MGKIYISYSDLFILTYFFKSKSTFAFLRSFLCNYLKINTIFLKYIIIIIIIIVIIIIINYYYYYLFF